MYISKIEINNFRTFKETTINFNEGINIFIGHNNAGKTNLFKAMSLIFSDNRYRPDLNDFNKNRPVDFYFEENKEGNFQPPKIKISVYIKESPNEENEKEDDNSTVYNWLIKNQKPYLSKLTYEYFLPQGEDWDNYQNDIKKIKKNNDKEKYKEEFWKLMKRKYIRKYIYRIYGGKEELKNTAGSEYLNKFDFQLLDAIRDVGNQLFTGKNTMLKDVLNYFLDYDLSEKKEEDRKEKEKERNKKFRKKSSELIDDLNKRIDTDPILNYARDVGASIGGVPDFQGEIDETELFSALHLIVKNETGIEIPATLNGLGYNNLIYISILLSKMQMSCTDYVNKDEQKVFPMLFIEEPEAHLHPSMQFKFLKFLRNQLEEKGKVRQIFVSTHSTHITAAVDLDSIIILNKADNKLNISYPGRVFDKSKDKDLKSKAYVKRFLDATKSDMLFAKNIILVEGIAEQLLMTCFEKYINFNNEKNVLSIEDSHTSVINIDGRYFDHFLKLFDYDSDNSHKKYAVNKKVICITDRDPVKKKKNKKNSRYSSCFPFELDLDQNNYKYKPTSSVLSDLQKKYKDKTNIKILTQEEGYGKTFEYNLVYKNPSCNMLITDFMSNRTELENLMDLYVQGKGLEKLLEKVNDSNLVKKINKCSENWSSNEKKKALIAARYLNSIKSKGEHALNLVYNLKENLKKEEPERFFVPDYIRKAIQEACQVGEF